jgi:hypothetical protein
MGLNPTILRQIAPVASAIAPSQITPHLDASTAKRFSPMTQSCLSRILPAKSKTGGKGKFASVAGKGG